MCQNVWYGGGTVVPQISMRAGVFIIVAVSIAFSTPVTVRLRSQSGKISALGSGYFMGVCDVSVMQNMWYGNGTVVPQISMRAGVFIIVAVSIAFSTPVTVRLRSQSGKISALGSGYFMGVCDVSVMQNMWYGNGTVVPQISMRAGVFIIVAVSIAFSTPVTVRLRSQSGKISALGSGYFMSVCDVSVMQDVWDGGGTVVPQISMRAGVFIIVAVSIAFSMPVTVRLRSQSGKMSALGSGYLMGVCDVSVMQNMWYGNGTVVPQISKRAGVFIIVAESIAFSMPMTVRVRGQSCKMNSLGSGYLMSVCDVSVMQNMWDGGWAVVVDRATKYHVNREYSHEVTVSEAGHFAAISKAKAHAGYGQDYIPRYGERSGAHHIISYHGPLTNPVVLKSGYLADTKLYID
ncbi:hypothetical protein J6590_000822 [Homalodisca vitripennis]|nr:hypothetical protein J6590_000822 [Homalodisca vitripennis]